MKFDLETRQSLILRLQDVHNQAAWTEFVEIYEPMIRRIASKLGLREADSVDATQEVLLHLTKVVGQWSPTHAGGSTFRGWLYRVARNVMIRWMRGEDLNTLPTGNGKLQQLLAEIPDRGEGDVVDIEFRRQVFARVAARIQDQFHLQTWNAFWMSVVESRSIQQVASELGMSPGSIYVARSRVMNRIRQEANKICEHEWEAATESHLKHEAELP